MWQRFQLYRALWKLAAIRRIVERDEYSGNPTVWQALRNIESLEKKIQEMRR